VRCPPSVSYPRLAAAHEGDVSVGPVYARIFRGDKVEFSGADSGVAPVYVIG